MTTVGDGDLVPTSIPPKLFVCVFVFTTMAIAGPLLSDVAGYLVEKQEMLLIKAFHEHQCPSVDDFGKENQTNRARGKLLLTVAILLTLIVIGIVVLHEVEDFDLIHFIVYVQQLRHWDMEIKAFQQKGDAFLQSFGSLPVLYLLLGSSCTLPS